MGRKKKAVSWKHDGRYRVTSIFHHGTVAVRALVLYSCQSISMMKAFGIIVCWERTKSPVERSVISFKLRIATSSRVSWQTPQFAVRKLSMVKTPR
jgi:hypothetical protein